MRVLRLSLSNFRCFKRLKFWPEEVNLLVGPNNVGKTAIIDALRLVLGTETRYGGCPIDEYDFYRKRYRWPEGKCPSGAEGEPADGTDWLSAAAQNSSGPRIMIEAVLGPLEDQDVRRPFAYALEAWDKENARIVPLDEDPEALDHHQACVRFVFHAWYDAEEDDFDCATVLGLPETGDIGAAPRVGTRAKRAAGFWAYREFRGSTRPITLSPEQLFHRVLRVHEAAPTSFDALIDRLRGSGEALRQHEGFARILREYYAEIQALLPFPRACDQLSFDVTNLTRRGVKEAAQAFLCLSQGDLQLPLEQFGAGTRSMATLAMLTMIAKRGPQAILAIEEPEAFLYPASQRTVVRQLRDAATQLFLTTHSPYVLDQFEPEDIAVVRLGEDGVGAVVRPPAQDVKEAKRYHRVFRTGLSEAMLSRHALLAEGQSDGPLIRGFAEIWARMSSGAGGPGLDELGVALVEVQGLTEAAPIASFLSKLDVQCLIVHDATSDEAVRSQLEACPAQTYAWRDAGIEALLARELPVAILAALLEWATAQPRIHNPPRAPLPTHEADLRECSQRLLQDNKGARRVYAELLSHCDAERFVPDSFAGLFRRLREWTGCDGHGRDSTDQGPAPGA